MEGKTKVTKEVLCEEARFILANIMAESKFGRKISSESIRKVCEGAVSIPFSEYVSFLVTSGYLTNDRVKESLEVTPVGEKVVNGGSLTELTAHAVVYFNNARARKRGPQLPPPDPTKRRGRDKPEVGNDVGRGGGQTLDSRYEKLEATGAGGVGTVYRARQIALNRQVALKEIRDPFSLFAAEKRSEIVQRFADVVRTNADLAHPNILPIHDVNLECEYPYVVTQFCEYGAVRRLISDAESIPVDLVLKYLLQTLHALQAAHQKGVSHRGLKPENMLLDSYGNIKVSDFGLSRIVERDQNAAQEVYVGKANVAYMAPEVFNCPEEVGPQTDIYALGIIFYELLTRKLPGRRSPLPSEIDPDLPMGLDNIFDVMTKDSLSERYRTVDDILSDFSKIDKIDGVLDKRQPIVAAENPLDVIKFKNDDGKDEKAESVVNRPTEASGSILKNVAMDRTPLS